MRRIVLFISAFLLLVYATGCDQNIPLDDSATVELVDPAKPADTSLQQILASSNSVVEVPAGSVDALDDAMTQAGERGVVLLKAGKHYESNTVEVNRTVSLVGEDGATLIVDTHPFTTTGVMKPAIHIRSAANVVVRSLEILPKNEIGGTAIFAENAPGSIISHNTILEHEIGFIIQHGDRSKIQNNKIVGSSGWKTGDIAVADGMLIVNGDFVEIIGNDVSNTVLGIFASDRKGLMTNNTTHGNVIGVILCNVPHFS